MDCTEDMRRIVCSRRVLEKREISHARDFRLCPRGGMRQNHAMPDHNPPTGTFITIEGIDGTGKSTQVRLLAEALKAQGREVVVSREPTDGPWGSKLRASATTGRLAPQDELEYFLNDRREHAETLISPSLAAGKTVILDRYYFSNMAYQGSRGISPEEIRRANEEFAPRPDHLIILDLPVEKALERIGARGDAANEFEQTASLARCREIFLSLSGEPFATVIDSSGTPEEVAARVLEAVAAGSKS